MTGRNSTKELKPKGEDIYGTDPYKNQLVLHFGYLY